MSQVEDMDYGSPPMQQQADHEQPPADVSPMQPQSDTVAVPMATMAIAEQSMATSDNHCQLR